MQLDSYYLRQKYSSETLHCVSKEFPTLKLSVTLSCLNRFSKFLHCQKAYEICYKTHFTLGMLLQYLEKLKMQISADIQPLWTKMQACCILIASNFVSRPQVLIFLSLKMGCLSPYWLQINFFMSLFFWLFTLLCR